MSNPNHDPFLSLNSSLTARLGGLVLGSVLSRPYANPSPTEAFQLAAPTPEPEEKIPATRQTLLGRAAAIGITVPSGMLAGFPEGTLYADDYAHGALVAAKRRHNPLPLSGPAQHERPANPYDYGVDVKVMPHAIHPIVEAIQKERPEAVFAADRGGRLVGLSTFWSWRKQYAGQRFPTIDNKIHFGRISSDLEQEQLGEVVGKMIARSGVWAEMEQRKVEANTTPVGIYLLDDWTIYGRTVSIFRDSLARRGFREGRDYTFTMATIAGSSLDGVRQIRGLTQQLRDSPWNNDSYAAAVEPSGTKVRPLRSPRGSQVRDAIRQEIDSAY